MIERLGRLLSEWSERYMPDPFIFAVGLTLVTLVLGVALGQEVADKTTLEATGWLLYHTNPDGSAGGWLEMFYSTPWMKFAMQMCIVLITGHALAKSRPVRATIERVADAAHSPGAAVILVALVACSASVLHWGLGAIAGAFMAREVGRAFSDRGVAVHYPLLGAAGYAGFLIWHGGMSGSAPLKVAESGHIGREVLGYEAAAVPAWVPDALPISQTLFSPVNLSLVGLSFVLIPALFWLLMPDDASEMEVRGPAEDETQSDGEDSSASGADTGEQSVLAAVTAGVGAAAGAVGLCVFLGWWVAGLFTVGALAAIRISTLGGSGPEASDESSSRAAIIRVLESTPMLNVLTWLLIGLGLVLLFESQGVAAWGLDSVNLLFLGLGILAHPSPRSYIDAVVEGTKGAAGIILQFPFYFGILGLLKASGLIHQIAEFFVGLSSPTTFPIFAFLSAGIVNFFVPSGGGQWAVQGQVVIEAAHSLGVDLEKAIVAFSWGDAWTNMLQPFWALPLLGIMDLEARDIVGYTALVMFVTGPLFMAVLVLM